MIRLLVAAGLAVVAAAGCAGSERAAFVPELPPTVAPVAGPEIPEAALPAEHPVLAKPVPADALLAPVDLGPGWRRAAVRPLGCSSSLPARPSRSTAMADRRGTLTETVSTGMEVHVAVAAWGRALAQCGWTVSDDSLGDAGVRARSSGGNETVLVTGTEGVVVLLHARGGLAAAKDELDGWADLALGTSCGAAPDGCH